MKKYCTVIRVICHTQMKILRRRYVLILDISMMRVCSVLPDLNDYTQFTE